MCNTCTGGCGCNNNNGCGCNSPSMLDSIANALGNLFPIYGGCGCNNNNNGCGCNNNNSCNCPDAYYARQYALLPNGSGSGICNCG